MITRTAVLAWGSLVWQPRNRHGAIQVVGPWRGDGPELPVEFARISADGRLTLVLVPGYPHRTRVLWAPSRFATLDRAIGNLARRETTAPRRAIPAVTASGHVLGDTDPAVASAVRKWMLQRDLDATTWTGLPQGDRWAPSGFSPSAALAYASTLEGSARDRAAEYVRRAPVSVATPLRPGLEAVFAKAHRRHR